MENSSFSREVNIRCGAALRAAPHLMENYRKVMNFPHFDFYFDFTLTVLFQFLNYFLFVCVFFVFSSLSVVRFRSILSATGQSGKFRKVYFFSF